MDASPGQFNLVNRFGFLLALGVLLLGIGMALLSIAVWLRFHVEMPADDIALFLPSVKIGLDNGWLAIPLDEWWAALGYAHRIVVTRLLMLTDYTFFGGKNNTIYISTWISIALLFVVYLRAFKSRTSENRTGHYFIAGIALIFLCTPSQYSNLVKTINSSWYSAAACSAISVWLLVSAGKHLTIGRTLLVMLFAATAALSNFFGVVTVLALPLVALYQRSKLWVMVLLFSIVFPILYLQGVHSDEVYNAEAFQRQLPAVIAKNPDVLTQAYENPTTQWSSWLPRWERVARRTSKQLGTPLSIKYPLIASLAVIGSVSLIVFLSLKLALDWYFRKEPASKSVQFYLAMAIICLGVSCATWIGRKFLVTPHSERYQTMVMVYWLSISCLVYCLAVQVGNQRKPLLAMFATVTIPVLFVWGTLDSSMPDVAKFNTRVGNEQALGRLALNPWSEVITKKPELPLNQLNYEILKDYAFRPLDKQSSHLPGTKNSDEFCSSIKVNSGPTAWPGVQNVSLDFTSNLKPFLTRLDLLGAGGELGSLFAKTSPNFQLRSVLLGSDQWKGYYRGDVTTSKPVHLIFQSKIGEPSYCVLQL